MKDITEEVKNWLLRSRRIKFIILLLICPVFLFSTNYYGVSLVDSIDIYQINETGNDIQENQEILFNMKKGDVFKILDRETKDPVLNQEWIHIKRYDGYSFYEGWISVIMNDIEIIRGFPVYEHFSITPYLEKISYFWEVLDNGSVWESDGTPYPTSHSLIFSKNDLAIIEYNDYGGGVLISEFIDVRPNNTYLFLGDAVLFDIGGNLIKLQIINENEIIIWWSKNENKKYKYVRAG